MTVKQPRYSKEEFARYGDEIYQTRIRRDPRRVRSGTAEHNNPCCWALPCGFRSLNPTYKK